MNTRTLTSPLRGGEKRPPGGGLGSSLGGLLLGPHGIDRYLELIRPELTLGEARARVEEVHHQTSRSVTVLARPNSAWRGFRAGQFTRVGVEIGGVRRVRTYSPAGSQHDSRTLELTVTVHPRGLVSRHLATHLRPGATLFLDPPQGDFVLPDARPERLVLISGGSGITPAMAMLRTLADEGWRGELDFIHFARTQADWLYEREVRRLAGRRATRRVRYLATREGGGHLHAGLLDDPECVMVCGPPPLIDATESLWGPDRVRSETFTAPALALGAPAARGTLRFARSGSEAPAGEGTLLEQAERAGLTPEYGCRMGICHTCTCRKLAGPVRNLLTGETSAEEDEDIQLCVSAPAGDVALDL